MGVARKLYKAGCRLTPEQTDKREAVGRLPFSMREGIELLEGVRSRLDMPLMTPEYQALTYAINLFKHTTTNKGVDDAL